MGKTFKESVMKGNGSSGSSGAKEFVITLKLEGTTKSVREEEKAEDKNDKVGSIAKTLLHTAATQALGVADYCINRTLALNDDYIGQRNLARAKQVASSVSGTISTAVSWAKTGASVGGVAGGVVGTVIGLVADGVSKAISIGEARDAQDISLRQQDAQLSFTRQRAGWSTEAASIGEDL